MDAAKAIFENTLHKLADFGFRCIVPLPGHGPWSRILDDVLPRVARAHPEVLIVGAPGVPLHPPGVQFKGDHAARWETAYGLALFPELVDMGALEMAHDEAEAWPRSGPPPQEDRHPLVVFDVSSPQFSQAGEDARRARAEEVQPMLDAVVEHVVGLVQRHLWRK
jgi:creatinine amidohydrolase/Fe(II)-dependent formamide hydrolase-like protein